MMCKWGNYINVKVVVPADLSHTGEDRVDHRKVDSCIAPIVDALNKGGVMTIASCCGHGRSPGNIALRDGRELIVSPDYETSRKIEKECDLWEVKDDNGNRRIHKG